MLRKNLNVRKKAANFTDNQGIRIYIYLVIDVVAYYRMTICEAT